ncbi:integrase core domain-containing protein, partial [Thomasclavelia cocleata]|uniref:integrase core domain-containing protein n=1 Tax=Thomasclavelia cocleata TaxID=69824 RepID=UPI002557E2C9
VYLNSIMDLYSRKIIAWTLSRTLEVDEVLKCLETAKGMIRSYSGKGNPWDNACIESYHAVIKREWLNRFKIMNYKHAYQLVFEYLEGFYNTVRIHSHCDYLSPNEYEMRYVLE